MKFSSLRQGSHPINESWLNTPLITNSAGKLVLYSTSTPAHRAGQLNKETYSSDLKKAPDTFILPPFLGRGNKKQQLVLSKKTIYPELSILAQLALQSTRFSPCTSFALHRIHQNLSLNSHAGLLSVNRPEPT